MQQKEDKEVDKEHIWLGQHKPRSINSISQDILFTPSASLKTYNFKATTLLISIILTVDM